MEDLIKLSYLKPNDQEFGALVRKLLQKTETLNTVKTYVDSVKGVMEVIYDYSDFTIRFNHWQKAPSDIEIYLFSKGFILDSFDDEDRYRVYFYKLK